MSPAMTILPMASAAQLRITMEVMHLCLTQHGESPVFGCPSCFLALVYCQPLINFSEGFLRHLVSRKVEVGAALVAKMEVVLAQFEQVPMKVMGHVVTQEGGAA